MNFAFDAQGVLLVAALAAAAAAAGFLRGYSGFGGGLVMAPFFTRIVGPAKSVVLISLVHLLTGFQGVRKSVTLTDNRVVLPLVVSAVVTVPLGVYLLDALQPQIVKYVVAAVVIVFALALSFGAELPAAPTISKSIAVGSLSGVLNGLCGIGGPPAVLYLLGGKASSDRLRASFILFFAVLYPMTVLTLAVAGLVSMASILNALILTPVYFLATEAGRRCFEIHPFALFCPGLHHRSVRVGFDDAAELRGLHRCERSPPPIFRRRVTRCMWMSRLDRRVQSRMRCSKSKTGG